MTRWVSRLGHMLSCREASRLLSRMQDEELPPLRRFMLKMHLTACDGCTRFKAQLEFLREAMQRYRA
ncbi:MAG TPA: zf-HC2 domain-containing protein [Casimicrobiaceae bacterium]|nr:zf-HC2 domain-containing protein [Casimicrobiaceae bacterium]